MVDQNFCLFLTASSSSAVYSRDDLDVIDSSGRTPLMVAALNGYLDVVNFLLHHGADLSET